MTALDESNLSGIKPKEFVHHVTFRLNDVQASLASDLRNTFANQTWGESHRWLYGHPEVIEIVKARIRGER